MAKGKRITHGLNTISVAGNNHKTAMAKFDFCAFLVTEHSCES
jgi:hypothetical protein